MQIRIFSRRVAATMAVTACASLASARADLIDYTTSGAFNGGSNVISFQSGTPTTTLSIEFDGTSQQVNSPLDFRTLGKFVVNVTPPTSIVDVPISPAPLFTLTINQSVPSSGTGSYNSATLTGHFSYDNGTAKVHFPNTLATIGNVTYQILNVNNNQDLVLNPPASNLGTKEVSALIELQVSMQSVIPEPGTLITTAAGALTLLGYGLVRRRSR